MSNSLGTPLYRLPPELAEEIRSLQLGEVKDDNFPSTVDPESGVIRVRRENSLLYFACSLCSKHFSSLEEQKNHYKSQEHLKQMKKQMQLEADDSESDEEEDPLDIVEDGCWISLSLSNKRITINKRLVESGFGNRDLNVSQLSSHLDGNFAVILYRSGFFILGIYKQGSLMNYYQEKRYTTRRKQGGAQHKKDNSSGKAISMGARLRRHNELLMQDFVRSTLKNIQDEIKDCSIIFLGTTKLNMYDRNKHDDV